MYCPACQLKWACTCTAMDLVIWRLCETLKELEGAANLTLEYFSPHPHWLLPVHSTQHYTEKHVSPLVTEEAVVIWILSIPFPMVLCGLGPSAWCCERRCSPRSGFRLLGICVWRGLWDCGLFSLFCMPAPRWVMTSPICSYHAVHLTTGPKAKGHWSL